MTIRTTNGEKTMTRYGTVHVGDTFECVKANGKRYYGTIANVRAFPKGTLVTIRFVGEMESDGRMYSLAEMPVEYRSIYLEDCVSWETERQEPIPA
jgi:flagellar basal body rod protein FlgG